MTQQEIDNCLSSLLYEDNLSNCSFVAGPQYLPHSEIMRLHVDEGYNLEPAQQMSYDKDSVDSYENRFDSFRMDYFDLAERSQKARSAPPAVTAVPVSNDLDSQNIVKKPDEESTVDSKAE